MYDRSTHSAYSDPGTYRHLLKQLPDHVPALCSAARNVIGHYRVELADLPASRHDEVNARWLATILSIDQSRHPFSLIEPRTPAERVAGCCRDHSLFVVGALRERDVPARTRVGFASYLVPGYFLDHVVVEFWGGTRWLRTDPELAPGSAAFNVDDLPTGSTAPFRTAAEAWRSYRRGEADPSLHCVNPGSEELSGPELIRTFVVLEIAHRYGDELLLWDRWEATDSAADEAWVDELASLLVRADSGDQHAENELASRYRDGGGLRPDETVIQYSPFGAPPTRISLR